MQADAFDKGQVVLGRYFLRQRLGGTDSRLFEASRSSDGRRLVVRVIQSDDALQAHQAQTVAETACAVHHPMLAEVVDCGVLADGQLFLVSEYVEGSPLHLWADAAGIPPISHILRFIEQLCLALDAAHAHGLTHGALFPRNILVHDQATPASDAPLDATLLDLGVLRDPARIDLHAAYYMAPEHLRGAMRADGDPPIFQVTPEMNTYACGAILYALCTGGPPFPYQSVEDVLVAQAQTPLVRASRINPRIPAALCQVITRSLSSSPTRRYRTARELAMALSSIQSTATSGVRPSPLPPTADQFMWTRREGTPDTAGPSPHDEQRHESHGFEERPTSELLPDDARDTLPPPAAAPSAQAPAPASLPAAPLGSFSSGPPRHVPEPIPSSPPRTPTPPLPRRSRRPPPKATAPSYDRHAAPPFIETIIESVEPQRPYAVVVASRDPTATLSRLPLRKPRLAFGLGMAVLAGIGFHSLLNAVDPPTTAPEVTAPAPLASAPAAIHGTHSDASERRVLPAATEHPPVLTARSSPLAAPNTPDTAETAEMPDAPEQDPAPPTQRASVATRSAPRTRPRRSAAPRPAKDLAHVPETEVKPRDSAARAAADEPPAARHDGSTDAATDHAATTVAATGVMAPPVATTPLTVVTPAVVPAATPPNRPASTPDPRPLRAQVAIRDLEVRGSLATSVVRNAIQRIRTDFAKCYASTAGQAGRNAFGAVELTLEIDERGRARNPRATGGALPGLDACLTQAAGRVVSRLTPDTGTVTATSKLVFSP